MEQKRAFEGIWIPKLLYLDEALTWSEKLLLLEIKSLDNEKGCYATNQYLADFFKLSKSSISKMVSRLQKLGYISVKIEYKKDNPKQVDKRIINITRSYAQKFIEGIGQDADTPIGKKSHYNNTKERDKQDIGDVELGSTLPLSEIIISHLNSKTGSNYKADTKQTLTLIGVLVEQGYSEADFKRVIDVKTREWQSDKKMCSYLRPITLFGKNFETYLRQPISPADCVCSTPADPENIARDENGNPIIF